MGERSRRRIRDLVARLAFEGLSENEIGCARISILARSNPLHQRAGYRRARPVTAAQQIQLATHGRSIQACQLHPFPLQSSTTSLLVPTWLKGVLAAIPPEKPDSSARRSEQEQAVAMNPSSAFAWGQSGWELVYAGCPEQALSHFQRTLRLNPRDPRARNYLSGMVLALIQLERDARLLRSDARRCNIAQTAQVRGACSQPVSR